jgi:4-hydroxy-tetrahydrodipicolinate reductase
MRLLLVGYGKMGRLVERLSPDFGFEVVGHLDDTNNLGGGGIPSAPDADVAVDFSVPSAVAENLPMLAARRMNIVIGTTGWQQHEAQMRRVAADAHIGVVAASNFSLGVALFQSLAEQAAKMFAPYPEYGAWIHEIHHSAKKDAPSGTAVTLQQGMQRSGYPRQIDMASSRAGSVPGTHTIGFDGPFETITMTHTNRDRAAFAQGALQAAKWVLGKRGWFGIKDVLEPAYVGEGGPVDPPEDL